MASLTEGAKKVLVKRNHHQRGEPIMGQGLLPCQYAEKTSRTGKTALAGVVPYLEVLVVAGVPKCRAAMWRLWHGRRRLAQHAIVFERPRLTACGSRRRALDAQGLLWRVA